MTNQKNCAIYSMADAEYDNYETRFCDKHIVIEDGHLATQFY